MLKAVTKTNRGIWTKGLKAAAAFIMLAMVLAASGCTRQGGPGAEGTQNNVNRTLKVFNCGDYIGEGIVKQFEKETGISVIYDEFDTNEQMYSKLKSGAQYDLLIPSDYMIAKMKAEGRLQKIDMSKIDNYSNMDPALLHREFDPQQEYSVPYMWGTLGIAYDTETVTEPVDSFDILWDTKYPRGVFMINSMRDAMGVALHKLGYSMNTTDPNEINAARDELIRQKTDGVFLALTLDDVKDKMAKRDAQMAVCYSGEGFQIEKNSGNVVKYALPKDGTNLWVDCMVLPKDSENVEGAYKFINFMCRKDIALTNVEYTEYATPLLDVKNELPAEIKNDPMRYPSAAYLKKCESYVDLGDALSLYSTAWNEYKAAQ